MLFGIASSVVNVAKQTLKYGAIAGGGYALAKREEIWDGVTGWFASEGESVARNRRRRKTKNKKSNAAVPTRARHAKAAGQ